MRSAGRAGIEVTRALTGAAVAHPLRVVMVTTFDLDEYVYGALRGASPDRRRAPQGRTNHEIAAELFISLSTVKSHLSGIQNKLGLRNRVEIVTWAWENHIMAPPDC